MFNSLQILRGIAAWAVVFHHYTQSFYSFDVENSLAVVFAKYGSIGVHIFFVLSGFVMALSVQKKSPSASQFL